jgi:hypothetical protein
MRAELSQRDNCHHSIGVVSNRAIFRFQLGLVVLIFNAMNAIPLWRALLSDEGAKSGVKLCSRPPRHGVFRGLAATAA